MTRGLPHRPDESSQNGARPPPLLPVSGATKPYWRSQLHDLDEYRSTAELPSECDIAIIGAGMSGVATAYNLLQLSGDKPKPSIVLLEARQICSGATGRNGGHVKVLTSSIQRLKKQHGIETAETFAAFVSDQIYALKNVVETEELDCEFELRRSYDVFLDDDEGQQAEQHFRESVRNGEHWTKETNLVLKPNVEEITSIKGAKVALGVPACSFWPYKFVTQLLALMVDQINVQTNTTVTGVSIQEGSDWQAISTSRGVLRAKKVIFATNGYTGGICPTYTNKIVPYRGTACHISPDKSFAVPHLATTYNIAYGPDKVDYLNPRPDGGIVVGGGKWKYADDRDSWYNNWDDSTLLPGADAHFDGLMQRYFRGWDHSLATTDCLWTGIQASTADQMPHVGEVPDSEGKQFVISGFNGGGNAQIFLSSVGLAKIVGEGKTFSETGLPWFFEPSHDRLREEPV